MSSTLAEDLMWVLFSCFSCFRRKKILQIWKIPKEKIYNIKPPHPIPKMCSRYFCSDDASAVRSASCSLGVLCKVEHCKSSGTCCCSWSVFFCFTVDLWAFTLSQVPTKPRIKFRSFDDSYYKRKLVCHVHFSCCNNFTGQVKPLS